MCYPLIPSRNIVQNCTWCKKAHKKFRVSLSCLAWSNLWADGLGVEDQKERSPRRPDFTRVWLPFSGDGQKWVYLTTPRTPDEQYQKTWGTFVVVPPEFKDRFSVFHTALSSKGTCARKILSQCWNLTRNGNARALKCRHSYSTSNTALQSRDMAWNITNLPENHPVYESPKITHTQTHINIWMYAYIHTYTHIHTYVHTYISYIHTNMHTYIHT